MNRIDLRLGWKATSVNTEKRGVEAIRTKDDSTETIEYDTLVLTTGARTSTVPVPGSDLKGVFTIRTMNDVERLTNHLAENNAKRVAVIGAGLTGSEMAEALLQRGLAVLEAEIVPEILPVILDPDMALIIRTRAEEHGVEYHLQSTLEEIKGRNGRVSRIRITGTEHPVDAVDNRQIVRSRGFLLRTYDSTFGKVGNTPSICQSDRVYAAPILSRWERSHGQASGGSERRSTFRRSTRGRGGRYFARQLRFHGRTLRVDRTGVRGD